MTTDFEALDPIFAEAAEAAYWARLYGRWEPMSLPEVRAFMDGFARPWWIVGGWSVDAFTHRPREHSDVDVSILASDVPALREHVRGRWDLWNIHHGAMRPLIDAYPEVIAAASQIWVRANGDAPWVIDLPLTPDVDGRWTNKFLLDHEAPLDEVTWVAEDGVRYLRPEITLFFKARTRRTKDERDFYTAMPLLDDERRAWLIDAIRRAWGSDHPWTSRSAAAANA